MTAGHEKRVMGLNGGRVISDTNAYTGTWCGLKVVTDAVIASITAADVTNVSAYTTETLTQGFVLHANITAITLTSGKVQMFDTE